MSSLQTYDHFKLDFQKVDQHSVGQVVNPRHQTPQGQSVAKPDTKQYDTHDAIFKICDFHLNSHM